MSRIKPVSRLSHQFGHVLVTPKLTSQGIAEALLKAKLIEPVSYLADGTLTQYRESDFLRSLTPNLFVLCVRDAILALPELESVSVRISYIQLTDVRMSGYCELTATLSAIDLEPAERRSLCLSRTEQDVEVELVGSFSVSQGEITLKKSMRVYPKGENKVWIEVSADRFCVQDLVRTVEQELLTEGKL